VETYPILTGQKLRLRVISSIACTLRASIKVKYDRGDLSNIGVPDVTTAGTRTDETFESQSVALATGVITDARVELLSSTATPGTKYRGRCYVRLDLVGAQSGPWLVGDYVYQGHEGALGQYISPGPTGGGGYRTTITLKADGAPAATTTVALDVANAYRRWHAFLWLYNASADAADRVLALGIRTPIASALPTGFGGGGPADVYRLSGAPSLQASEEGAMYVGAKYAMVNDNGTITVQSTATAPTPLPLDVTEDDTQADAVFSVADGNANDRDIIFGDREEWLVPG